MGLDPVARMREAWRNGGRYTILGSIIVALAVTILAVVIYTGRVGPPYDPFGQFPVQDVTLTDRVIEVERASGSLQSLTLPVLVVEGERWPDVPVEGTKCYDEPVTVAGSVRWQLVIPPGSIVDLGDGSATRVAGCSSFQFLNPVPEDVRIRVRDLAEDGVSISVWQINGAETPLGHDGDVVTQGWETENFAIEYRG